VLNSDHGGTHLLSLSCAQGITANPLQTLDLPRLQKVAGDPPESLLGIGDEKLVLHRAG
jgi:hypothetical protein